MIAWQLAWKHFFPLAIGGLAVAVSTMAFRLVTTRFGFSLKKLSPDLAAPEPARQDQGIAAAEPAQPAAVDDPAAGISLGGLRDCARQDGRLPGAAHGDASARAGAFSAGR